MLHPLTQPMLDLADPPTPGRQDMHCFRDYRSVFAGKRPASLFRAPATTPSNAARATPVTTPHSVSNPSRLLICIVQNYTNYWGIRFRAGNAGWGLVFTAATLLPICVTVRIAREYAASFLLRSTASVTWSTFSIDRRTNVGTYCKIPSR
jgi:hypothetical protein